MTTERAAKTALNEQFARIGKALSGPRRIELLDLLAQGERPVESLAAASDMSVALASSHLQTLRAARLVEAAGTGGGSTTGSPATTSMSSSPPSAPWRESGSPNSRWPSPRT